MIGSLGFHLPHKLADANTTKITCDQFRLFTLGTGKNGKMTNK
jgi:hypothetical protein